MNKTLSVIVPVYNTVQYLDECVRSILPQLLPGDKIILIDDGSNDGSESLCLGYADKFPDTVITKRTDNVGVSEARNTGIRMCTTDYIAFCDADDCYTDGGIKILRDAVSNYQGTIAIGNFTQKRNTAKSKKYNIDYLSSGIALLYTLYQRHGYHESAWAKMYPREIFDRIDGFLQGRRYEDIEIIPRLYLNAKAVIFIDATVYYYRPNPDSFINTWSDSRADAVFAAQSVLNYVTEHFDDAVPAAQSRLFSAAFNIFGLASLHGKTALADSCWQLITQLRNSIVRDKSVRLKNKLGVALSLLGRSVAATIAKRVYR